MDSLGLYVHIPFCRSKCAYCDFVSYAGKETIHAEYVQALLREARHNRGQRIDSIYIGGGTPTILGPELLQALLAELQRLFVLVPHCEITVEANPGTIDLDLFRALRDSGVNRLSLGAQSFCDGDLERLGRRHSVRETVIAVCDARRAGFRNIGLDLMFGLPLQSMDDFQRTLDQAVELNPDHLSLYALTLEEGTPLARRIDLGCVPMPDPDLAAGMYEFARESLRLRGYIHYEISNWARSSQYVCRHNLRYWHRRPYIGLGAGAHSFVSGLRFRNTSSPEDYIGLIRDASHRPELPVPLSPGPAAVEIEQIGREAAMSETMFLGLRMLDGVSRAAFYETFGVEMEEVYPDALAELAQTGLLELDSDSVRLSERGILLGNEVFCRFVSSP